MTPAGVALVKKYEGLRLRVYRYPAGYPTIGYGHRVPDMTQPPITVAQAELWLQDDLAVAEEGALALAPDLGACPDRLAALTDLVFNIGRGALDGENPYDPLDDATVVRRLREQRWPEAAAAFRRWCHARVQGQLVQLPGLVIRREVGARWIETGC